MQQEIIFPGLFNKAFLYPKKTFENFFEFIVFKYLENILAINTIESFTASVF